MEENTRDNDKADRQKTGEPRNPSMGHVAMGKSVLGEPSGIKDRQVLCDRSTVHLIVNGECRFCHERFVPESETEGLIEERAPLEWGDLD